MIITFKKDTCSLCNGDGWIEKQPYAGDMYTTSPPPMIYAKCPRCNGGKAVISNEILGRSGILEKYQRERISNFNWSLYPIDTSAKSNVVSHLVNHFDKWQGSNVGLYIYSKTRGSGKTMLASLIGVEVAKRGYSVKFVPEGELINLSRDDNANPILNNNIDALKKCDLLVIDDFAHQKANDWLSNILFEIIDYRVSHSKIMILTSNEEIKHVKMDDRITSRINEVCQVIAMPEYDVRSMKGNATRKALLYGIYDDNKRKEIKNETNRTN